jgi:hypothetical protein
VLPGVPLLSCWHLSGLHVDVAILFGPGLIALMVIVFLFIVLVWLPLDMDRAGAEGC